MNLVSVDRGSAIIETKNTRFKVNGEWCLDNTWWVFPKMVYKQSADGTWAPLGSAAQQDAVVQMLCKVWPTEEGALRLVSDEE